MQLHAHPALVLNADYQPLSYFPLSTIPWERAVKAVVEATHAVVEEYPIVLRSPSTSMRLPSVLALRRYQPVPKHVAFTRFNVFLRDRFSCQYCGERHSTSDLTFDHVTPRSKGGVTAWDNVVAACSPCNVRKDCRTPAQAKMWPRRAPRQPTPGELLAAKRAFPPNYLHDTWESYLYWDVTLEP
jgi:5-methylcytosine-specific restriction endonuclease McrA